MNKTKAIVFTLLIPLALNACGTVIEGLSVNKKKGSEEFLIEKKAPLVLPPSFGDLPLPAEKTDQDLASIEANSLSFKEIIDQNSSTDIDMNPIDPNKSIEKSIIEKINKNKIIEEEVKTGKEIIIMPKRKNFFQKFKEKLTKK
tara:strand:- start:396 stop:827 length:432 start_codon:yes stop_codon:yes gene_type:complete